MTGLIFKFKAVVYRKKSIIWTEKDKIMKFLTFLENKRDYEACLKNTANFIDAEIYNINL